MFLAIATPNFLNLDTILNILAQGSYAAIVGYGMTLALMSGGFDLSVESVMALVSVFLAILIPAIGIPLAILVSVAIGSVVGLLNGLIIAKLKVNPLITTLSMSTIIKGVALLVAGGWDDRDSAEAVHDHRDRQAPRRPHPHLRDGRVLRHLLPHRLSHLLRPARGGGGSNESASRISGLNVDGVKIGVYVLVALMAGVASVIRTSQALIGMPSMSPGFVLTVLTVTILGGTSLSGGRGNLWGTMLAGIFVSMIYYGLNLINVQIFYQMLAVGLVLMLALFIEGLRVRYLNAAKAKGIKV